MRTALIALAAVLLTAPLIARQTLPPHERAKLRVQRAQAKAVARQVRIEYARYGQRSQCLPGGRDQTAAEIAQATLQRRYLEAMQKRREQQPRHSGGRYYFAVQRPIEWSEQIPAND